MPCFPSEAGGPRFWTRDASIFGRRSDTSCRGDRQPVKCRRHLPDHLLRVSASRRAPRTADTPLARTPRLSGDGWVSLRRCWVPLTSSRFRRGSLIGHGRSISTPSACGQTSTRGTSSGAGARASVSGSPSGSDGSGHRRRTVTSHSTSRTSPRHGQSSRPRGSSLPARPSTRVFPQPARSPGGSRAWKPTRVRTAAQAVARELRESA